MRTKSFEVPVQQVVEFAEIIEENQIEAVLTVATKTCCHSKLIMKEDNAQPLWN